MRWQGDHRETWVSCQGAGCKTKKCFNLQRTSEQIKEQKKKRKKTASGPNFHFYCCRPFELHVDRTWPLLKGETKQIETFQFPNGSFFLRCGEIIVSVVCIKMSYTHCWALVGRNNKSINAIWLITPWLDEAGVIFIQTRWKGQTATFVGERTRTSHDLINYN